jgi:hypothetical protein
MSITDLLNRNCTQTAVYWGNPVENGTGGKTFDAPVEIYCRMEQKDQLVRGWDMKGNTFDYIYLAYVLQDLDVEGCFFLGALDDLTTQQKASPMGVEGVHVIKQFEKVPSLGSTTEFVRRAFLTQYQYR